MAIEHDGETEVNIKLTGDSAERYIRLMEICETEEDDAVLKAALRLFEDAIKERQAGRKLFLKPGKGKFVEYKVFAG